MSTLFATSSFRIRCVVSSSTASRDRWGSRKSAGRLGSQLLGRGLQRRGWHSGWWTCSPYGFSPQDDGYLIVFEAELWYITTLELVLWWGLYVLKHMRISLTFHVDILIGSMKRYLERREERGRGCLGLYVVPSPRPFISLFSQLYSCKVYQDELVSLCLLNWMAPLSPPISHSSDWLSDSLVSRQIR